MRRLIGTVGGISVLWCMGIVAAWGQEAAGEATQSVPRLIRFSGTVRQAGEKPAVGVAELSFSLYKEESGGEPLWFESQTVEVDAQGRYNVLLGAMHADGLPMDLFTSGEARWLSIMVGKVEQPRVLLVSVPYALKAADAESLGGKPATAFVATEQLKEQVATAMSDPKIAQRSLNTAVLASTGGTTPPAVINEVTPATFTCTAASACVGVTQNGTGHGVQAVQTATTGATNGVRGQAVSTSGTGVLGLATATTGTNYGVRGQVASTGGIAVHGLATAATGTTYGVYGQSASTSGRGIFGYSTATTGVTYGILGTAASTSGVGLQGQEVSLTGNTIGLRAETKSPDSIAAIFDNLGGGKLISARTTGFIEKFSVDGGGHLVSVASSGTAISGDGGAGKGVYGYGASMGVQGSSANYGVYGSGTNYGVYGTGITGVFGGGTTNGVYGFGTDSGVRGQSDNGKALYGTSVNGYAVQAFSTAGFGIHAASENGIAGSFHITDIGAKLIQGTSGEGANEIFTVLGNGSVGIGTVVPAAQLHIDGIDAPDTTDLSGTTANTALLAVGGTGGDAEDTAGNGGPITLISGPGGAALGGNNGGGAANLTVGGGIGGTFVGGGKGGSISLEPGLGGSPGGTVGNVLLAPANGGRVGIGTSSPTEKLQVFGDIRVGTSGSNGCIKDFGGSGIVGSCSSDLRFKTNVMAYPAVLAKLAQLTPVTYDWKAAEFPERHFGTERSFGLIAQDVEKLFPDMVIEDSEGYKAVKYHKLPFLMLQGIRELKAENDNLKADNNELKAAKSHLEQQLSRNHDEIGTLRDQLTGVLSRLAELEKARN